HRAVEALGLEWFKARPKTKFEEWDFQVRAKLLEKAKALGRIPEGSLEEVRDALWKGVKKFPPGAVPKEAGKPERMTTPYGTAWCPCAGVLMAAPKSQVPRKEDVEALQHGFVPNVRNLAMYWFIGLDDHNCMPGTYLYAWDALQDLKKHDPGGYERLNFYTVP